MIPVEQTIMGGDSTMPGVHGNCLQACVASVFELPLDEVPHFVAEDDWHGAFSRWIESRGFKLGSAFQRFADDDRMTLTGHPSKGIYWIASVYSPRLVHEDGSPGQHVVVMNGGEQVWDPHPKREMGHLGFVGIGYTFTAPDPAQLVLRDVDALPERRVLREHLRANPDATVNPLLVSEPLGALRADGGDGLRCRGQWRPPGRAGSGSSPRAAGRRLARGTGAGMSQRPEIPLPALREETDAPLPDAVLRELIGWPVARRPETDSEIVHGLRERLRELRRARERRLGQ